MIGINCTCVCARVRAHACVRAPVCVRVHPCACTRARGRLSACARLRACACVCSFVLSSRAFLLSLVTVVRCARKRESVTHKFLYAKALGYASFASLQFYMPIAYRHTSAWYDDKLSASLIWLHTTLNWLL